MATSQLNLFLLRNMVEKEQKEKNRVYTETSAVLKSNKTTITKRIQEMKQTCRSKWPSGLMEELAFHRSGVMSKYTCLAYAQLHFSKEYFGDMSVCVLAVVTKACLCGSGEADDGVRGAPGSRWCYAVEGRGVRLHPQSALHLQRGWDSCVSHHTVKTQILNKSSIYKLKWRSFSCKM